MGQNLTADTSSLVDLFVTLAKKRRGRENDIQELLNTENTEQKAVLAIVRIFEIAREVYGFSSQYPYVLQDFIKLIEQYEAIKNGLRAWRNTDSQNILFLVMPVYDKNFEDVKRFIDVLGADLLEEQDIHGNIALTKMSWRFLNEAMKTCFNDKKYFALMKQWWIKSMPAYNEIEAGLFEYFEWSEEDRLKLENQVNNSYRGYFEPQESRLWLLLAKKFPRNGDEVLKLKVLLQRNNERHLVQLMLAHHSKEIDIRVLIPKQMNNWPSTFSGKIGNYFIPMFRRIPVHEVNDELRKTISRFHPDLQRYLITRTATPSWILEVFAKKLIPNTIDFFSLADQQYNKTSTIDNISTFNFEELPSDIIFCIARLLSYKHIILLSLTNKRMHSTIANNEYLIKHLCRRYLTGITVPAAEFLQKLRSRERKYRLFSIATKPTNVNIKSIELTKEDILISFKSSYTLRWYKIDEKGRSSISYFGSLSLPTWTDANLSARVYKQQSYAVHGQTITVVSGGTWYSLTGTHLTKSDLINDRHGYFQMTEKNLIGLGYWMDLTTNQIQPCPWTTDLITIQMSNDNANTGYGIDSSCHVIKQFDVRASSVTSSQSAVSVHDGVVQNFAVRNDGHTMFVAARHVSEWDTRALRAPVKMSSDLNLTYSEQCGQSRPAIDLTSMKMIGRDQIWDLADFTWKFDRNLHNANKIANNGQICIYEQQGVLNIHRTGCDSYFATDFYCG